MKDEKYVLDSTSYFIRMLCSLLRIGRKLSCRYKKLVVRMWKVKNITSLCSVGNKTVSCRHDFTETSAKITSFSYGGRSGG